MKRIEIFVEGISELIFVRDILQKLYNYDSSLIFIHCTSLNTRTNPSDLWSFGNPSAKYYIEITDVVGYTNLLSAITNRRQRLSENKVDLVIGLRDIDSEEYKEYKNSHNRNDSIRMVEEGVQKGLKLYSFTMQVTIFYAVTELEAWFLALDKVYPQIDTRLTQDYIKTNIGIDLVNIDPENDLEKPSDDLTKILALVNKHDDKPRRTNIIITHITLDQIEDLRTKKVAHLFKFIDMLKSF